MDTRQHPLWAAFSIGRWFETEVRVSYLFPITLFILCYGLGWQTGAGVWLILFFSILLHEFAHVIAARRSGGSGDEILMWPLGGLAFVKPAPHIWSELATAAAGPAANGLICLATLYWVVLAGNPPAAFHPVFIPTFDRAAAWGPQLALLIFSINFKLLVLNLLPIHPLDGGQIMFHLAKEQWDRQTARIGTLWVSILCAMFVVVGGYVSELDTVMLVGWTLMALASYEFLLAQVARQFEDPFATDDFSQGYTGLDDDPESRPRRPGVLERWRQEREARRREQEELQRIAAERRLDELLEKINQRGMASLTEEEKRFLNQASNRYRSSGS